MSIILPRRKLLKVAIAAPFILKASAAEAFIRGGGCNGICLDGGFSRSSVDLTQSSVSGAGSSATVTIAPKMQQSEVTSPTPHTNRWLMPVARVRGVAGYRPTFIFSLYANSTATNGYWGFAWQSTRRPYFSYDYVNWTMFDTNVTVGASTITFRHSTVFTQDVVYISYGRTWTAAQHGAWITAIAAANPTLISHVGSNISGYQSGTFSAQVDSQGKTVPATPFYGFKVADASLGTPPKKVMVMTGGVHAGEDQGDYVMKGAVEYLLGSSSDAIHVRTFFDTYVYSQVNAPGREGGGWRGSFTAGAGSIDDANRHFSDASPGLEIVTIPRTAMLADLPTHVDISYDYHGDFGFGTTANFSYYSNSDANLGIWATAMNTFLSPTILHDYGALPSGAIPVWFKNNFSTLYYLAPETSDAVPLTDSDVALWGQRTIQTVSLMLTNGNI